MSVDLGAPNKKGHNVHFPTPSRLEQHLAIPPRAFNRQELMDIASHWLHKNRADARWHQINDAYVDVVELLIDEELDTTQGERAVEKLRERVETIMD